MKVRLAYKLSKTEKSKNANHMHNVYVCALVRNQKAVKKNMKWLY